MKEHNKEIISMRYSLENEQITLFFEGEINSYNSENVEKEIEDTLHGKTFKTLFLNFEHLSYISSAGLRIILKLKQKYDDTHIIDASLEVYDVLSMTGFVNIMDVKKAMKRVYISGAKVIGEGFFSTVYRIDKDTIIKVFNRVSDPQQIERELRLAKQAFVLGIPTAISYDIVKVDDKLGVRFEMLDCMSLRDCLLQDKDKYDSLVDKYVALLKKINTTDCMNPNLPNMKTFYLEKVEAVKPYLDEKQYKKIHELVNAIPDSMTFVHGDCHFKNILVQGDDLLLIDMDTLSRGAPIFELAAIRAPYIAFEEDEPGNNEKFLGVTPEFSAKLYNDVVTRYLGKDDEAAKDKIALVCYLHMMWWTLTNQKDNTKRFEGCKERFIKLLDKCSDLTL